MRRSKFKKILYNRYVIFYRYFIYISYYTLGIYIIIIINTHTLFYHVIPLSLKQTFMRTIYKTIQKPKINPRDIKKKYLNPS